MKKHEEDPIHEEPFKNWRRKRYKGAKPKPEDDPPGLAEIETDRDLDKPVEQLLCDVYEGYTHWLRETKSAGSPEEMKKPVELILYTLARTASMNAVVARSNKQLQAKVGVLTRIIVYLTLGMFLLMAIQSWIVSCVPQ